MWSPPDWKAFKAKYQWLLKWDCGHCFGPISIQLLYPQQCGWPREKKDRVITNAHRRSSNNWVGIPYIISCAGREEAELNWKSQHSLFFLKSTQLYLITKYSRDILRFSIVCDSLSGAFWENVSLFMREMINWSVTVSVSLCIWISTAIVITGIHLHI